MSTGNIIKGLSSSDILIFTGVAAIAYYMVTDMCKTEGFEGDDVPMPSFVKGKNENKKMVQESVNGIQPYEESSAAPVGFNQQISTNTGSGCDSLKFVSTNLLPKGDDNLDNSFAEFSPASLEGQNFIDSRNFTLGMQSQVLRNANLQLRDEPINPQEPACSWNQSTIVPEVRRPLQLGSHLAE